VGIYPPRVEPIKTPIQINVLVVIPLVYHKLYRHHSNH
jgi:hypothetical protein